MAFLELNYLGSSLAQWITAALTAVAVFAGLRLIERFVIRRLIALSERTHNRLDDLAANVLRRTRRWFLLAVGLYAGSRILALPDGVDRLIGGAAVLALLVQGAIWGNVAITFAIARYMERNLEDDAATATTVRFLGFISRLILWAVILLLALDNLGIDITALVAGLGVGGIAVALAVQNILGDLFASLSIVLDKPFVIGDFVIVGDLMGTVEHVGLKTTRIRSLSGEQLVFSNADLLSSRIRNFKRMYERRVLFVLGVTYETEREKLAAIPGVIREIVEAQELTRFDRAHFKAFGAFSLDFEVVYYVLDSEYNVYMDIQQAINLEIFRRFEELGIEFAYPTQVLYVRQTAAVAAGGS